MHDKFRDKEGRDNVLKSDKKARSGQGGQGGQVREHIRGIIG